MNKDKIKKIFNKIGLDIYRHDNRYYRTTYLRPKYACDVRVNEQDFCFGKKVGAIQSERWGCREKMRYTQYIALIIYKQQYIVGKMHYPTVPFRDCGDS